jgi:hypothetical protein
MNDAQDMIEIRNNEYADAWRLQGEICQTPAIKSGLEKLLIELPQAWFPWIMILNKLLRIFGSPVNPDHWLDIAGYATLVHNHLTKDKNG